MNDKSKYTCTKCGKSFPVTARNFARANLHEQGKCEEAEKVI